MYSRYHGRQDAGIELPRGYGGNAFSAERTETGSGRIEIARPTAESVPAVEPQHPSPPPPPPLTARLLPMGKGFPLAHGIGFEELLILGLILLLSQSDAGSDTVLWLCLLLFCG